MTSNAPKIILTATTVTPVKVITNVQHITMPTTTPTHVPIQMGSTRPVTRVTTMIPSATGTQAMPGGEQPGSLVDHGVVNRDLSGKIASPDDYVKLNPQPEPPLPASGGVLDSVIGFFSGLFGGNKLKTGSVAVPLDSRSGNSGYGEISAEFNKTNLGTVDNIQTMPFTVISPKSGDSFIKGDPVQIRWIGQRRYPADSPFNKVNILLISQNATSWSITSLGYHVPDTGSFTWDTGSYIVMAGEQPYYEIQVMTIDRGDESTSNRFILYPDEQTANRYKSMKVKTQSKMQVANGVTDVTIPASMTITSPKKGDIFSPGDIIPIRWTPSGNFNRLCLAFFGESSVNRLLLCDIPDTGYYAWRYTLPDITPVKDEEQFFIEFYNAPTPSSSVPVAESGSFSLWSHPVRDPGAGIIEMSRPLDGETIQGSAPIDILWAREFGRPEPYDTVVISLCSRDGTVLKTLISPAGNTGHFSCDQDCHRFWPFPNADNNHLYIDISTADGKFRGKSGVFTFS
jgi:hypothetical protein